MKIRKLKPAKHHFKSISLVFIVLFAVAGGYAIWRSLAATSSIGDLNNDGVVNIIDLSILLTNYGSTNPTADINNDGQVNVIDMSILLTNFGANAAPSSSCTGVNASPSMDLQNLLNSQPSGTIFCFQPGTYKLTSSVLVPSSDSLIGQSGVIIDGQGQVDKAFWGNGGSAGQQHVTIKNMVIQHFTGDAVALGWYGQVTNNELLNNQVGVSVNSYSTLDSNYIHDNYQYGVTGGPGTNMTISNNEIAHNNSSNYCGGSCIGNSGGSKIVGSTAGTYGLTWDNNNVHDNIGNGIWSDGNVHNAVYKNNTITNNSGDGIIHEISWDAVISNNTLSNNDSDDVGQSCWHGAQIHVNTSSNVDISGNSLTGSNGANGICAVSADRSEVAPYPTVVANLYVHDNTEYLSGSASNGLVVTTTAAKQSAATNNRFVNNSYHVSNTAGQYFEWPNLTNSYVQANWTTWRQTDGQDLTGSLVIW